MKKSYDTPTLVICGTAIRETRIGSPFLSRETLIAKPWPGGGMGFNL